jgi:hypothetical protein
LVLAHLKTLETRQDPGSRSAWKLRLVRGLYERGLKREDVQQLFRFIDWMMELPEGPDKQFWHEMQQYEKEKQMPYVTSIERLALQRERAEGLREGLLKGLALSLALKFGPGAKKLMTRVRRIKDVAALDALYRTVETASSLDEVRQALP